MKKIILLSFLLALSLGAFSQVNNCPDGVCSYGLCGRTIYGYATPELMLLDSFMRHGGLPVTVGGVTGNTDSLLLKGLFDGSGFPFLEDGQSGTGVFTDANTKSVFTDVNNNSVFRQPGLDGLSYLADQAGNGVGSIDSAILSELAIIKPYITKGATGVLIDTINVGNGGTYVIPANYLVIGGITNTQAKMIYPTNFVISYLLPLEESILLGIIPTNQLTLNILNNVPSHHVKMAAALSTGYLLLAHY